MRNKTFTSIILLSLIISILSFIKEVDIYKTDLNNETVEIGDKYYDFEAYNQKEEVVKFSELFDGRYILLDFTLTYCGACIESSKELHEINKSYSKNVKIISFTVDKNITKWHEYIKRDSISWTSLWDGKGFRSNTCKRYGIKGGPFFFLINPEGKVIDIFFGYYEGRLINKLDEHKIIK